MAKSGKIQENIVFGNSDQKIFEPCPHQDDQVVELEMKPANSDHPPLVVFTALSRADRPSPIVFPDLRADPGKQRTPLKVSAKVIWDFRNQSPKKFFRTGANPVLHRGGTC